MDGDYRGYVFLAYGLVLGILFLFTGWTWAQARAADRKLDDLRERFLKAHPGAMDEGEMRK